MITLAEPQEPFELSIKGNVFFVTVKPIDTVSWVASRTAARVRLDALMEPFKKLCEAGLVGESMEHDLSDPSTVEALGHMFLIEELARRHVTGWRGVQMKDGSAAEFNIDALVDLLKQHPYGQIFYHEFTFKYLERIEAKKDSAPVVTGTSGAELNSARIVKNSTFPAVEEKPMKKANFANMLRMNLPRWRR